VALRPQVTLGLPLSTSMAGVALTHHQCKLYVANPQTPMANSSWDFSRFGARPTASVDMELPCEVSFAAVTDLMQMQMHPCLCPRRASDGTVRAMPLVAER
jgi:hypothetical protein